MARAYRYISADGHLEVPVDKWTHRVPEKYRDRAPRRIKLHHGGDERAFGQSPQLRVFHRFAECARESELLRRREPLVAEEDRQVLEQRGADRVRHAGSKRLR